MLQLDSAAELSKSLLLAKHIQLDIEMGPDFYSYDESKMYLKVNLFEEK